MTALTEIPQSCSANFPTPGHRHAPRSAVAAVPSRTAARTPFGRREESLARTGGRHRLPSRSRVAGGSGAHPGTADSAQRPGRRTAATEAPCCAPWPTPLPRGGSLMLRPHAVEVALRVQHVAARRAAPGRRRTWTVVCGASTQVIMATDTGKSSGKAIYRPSAHELTTACASSCASRSTRRAANGGHAAEVRAGATQ